MEKSMDGKELLALIDSPRAAELFGELYGHDGVDTARQRYRGLIENMLSFDCRRDAQGENSAADGHGDGDLRLFSAPGRTELGGNHTDHNCGKVLAAAVHLDNVAVVQARKDNVVFFRSTGFPDVKINLTDSSGTLDLQPHPDEQGKAEALIRGMAAELSRRGKTVGGFSAVSDSLVLPGSGLSSSAALEVLIGSIFDTLYEDGKMSPLEIAQAGQVAENVYFGKPCGLMDQAASASGGAVAIDFAGTPAAEPRLRQIKFDIAFTGLSICVVNTGGSHADLTADYAAIPQEMKAAAAFFGKSVLAEMDRETLLAGAAGLRKAAGDRVLLRALHFFDENVRVDEMVTALDNLHRAVYVEEIQGALGHYLGLVSDSGESSWELLQNVFSPSNPSAQGLATALALTKDFFRNEKISGAYRVHGGGFAGTIQVYLPTDAIKIYRSYIEPVFGEGSLTELKIRQFGAGELEL